MQRIRWTGDKKILYATSFAVLVLPLLVLLLPIGQKRWSGAVTLALVTVLALYLVKKKTAPSIHHKQVLLLMAVFALLYTVLYYLLGIFFGFHRAITGFTLSTLFWYMLPITVLIVCSELLRTRLLAQRSKTASATAFACCVVAELLCFLANDSTNSLSRFMDLVALVFLPACIANVTYHYLAARYGASPNIAYRLIRTLLPYFILFEPSAPDALLAFAKLLSPLLILALMRLLYEKKEQTVKRKSKAPLFISYALLFAAMLCIALLTSNQFRFCALVIVTESMTGEINKGDIVVYERFDGQSPEEDQILVFQKDRSLIVHRIIRIEHINGETRYFTKGDANDAADPGYVTDSQIVGITKFSLPYIGQASIWLNGLFAGRS